MNARFIMIGGIGHCGTQWLANLLNQPQQGVRFHHQYKFTMSNKSWNTFLQMEDIGNIEPYIERYCNVMAGAKDMRVIGDAISWMPLSIPMIHERLPVARIIYLVRHPIPQINSIVTKSPFSPIYNNKWLYGTFLRRYWEAAGKPLKPWEQWIRWERVCFWWTTNAFMPAWLRRNMPTTLIDVVRLEDLTQNVGVLDALLKSVGITIHIGKLRNYQRKDVNRKVETSRVPAHILRRWSGAQKTAFRLICGPGMKKLGYKA